VTGNPLWRHLRRMENDLYRRVLHPQATAVATEETVGWEPEVLRGHKYCLVLTYRKNGTAVATPVWFGIGGDRVYFRTEAGSGKVKRIRRDPVVRLAPCTSRGRPTGPALTGLARVLDGDEEQTAERAIQAHYGLIRRLYEGVLGSRSASVYVEVSSPPAGAA
jgi:uncharacterized protein